MLLSANQIARIYFSGGPLLSDNGPMRLLGGPLVINFQNCLLKVNAKRKIHEKNKLRPNSHRKHHRKNNFMLMTL